MIPVQKKNPKTQQSNVLMLLRAFLWHTVGTLASMDDTLSFPNTLGLLVLLRFLQ